jgi:hypothetical protein
MTNIKYLLGTFVLLLMLSGCDDNDSGYVIESDPNRFGVYPVAIPVSAEGGTYELTITGNEAWTIELTEARLREMARK